MTVEARETLARTKQEGGEGKTLSGGRKVGPKEGRYTRQGSGGAQPVLPSFRGVTEAKCPGIAGTPERRLGEEGTFILEAGGREA